MTSNTKHLRIGVLYADLLNIYADRGNILFLKQRCRWRGIDCQITNIDIGKQLDPDAFDLLYIGGGQDRDQLLCAEDIATVQRDALHQAAADDTLILGICGGYQLLGDRYQTIEHNLPGAGLLEIATDQRSDASRLVGPIVIEVELTPGKRELLAGFENHAGRTSLQTPTEPLGKAVAGNGNDGISGYEGAQKKSVIGTYMHGPLLPKNAWFADWIIARATKQGVDDLQPLEDRFEKAAHQTALKAAGIV